jgi:hypothetical protein
MKCHILSVMVLGLMLSACAQSPKPAASAAPHASEAAAPMSSTVPQAVPAPDPALLATMQANLRALGYLVDKSADDSGFTKALIAFKKDQGLPQDGVVTEALVDRIKLLRAEVAKPAPPLSGATYLYDDGASGRTPMGLLVAPPVGLSADAPSNFMMPLRPGAQASYQLGKRTEDGNFTPAMTVTCRTGRITQANVPMGALDMIPVDCHSEGALQWRSLYSLKWGLVVRQERNNVMRDLVAIRPQTNDWPGAARTGLDWAVTHALDSTTSTSLQWSSTGVATHFEIRTAASLSGKDAGLTGKNTALYCRRFDLAQSGQPTLHYPGIACQNPAGLWALPGTIVTFAAPASHVAANAPQPATRTPN